MTFPDFTTGFLFGQNNTYSTYSTHCCSAQLDAMFSAASLLHPLAANNLLHHQLPSSTAGIRGGGPAACPAAPATQKAGRIMQEQGQEDRNS
ncbi:hypothetical protein GLAREA_08829 [Glarea lozoyensis ATCC 20868]|uniref:Uncharacterized protein n=1 Tax=Glarea lozoyensis (strain ATCC 20868 / MF5171) TaxID=1116229 RepID=S3DXK5_GLAL2|nr:uncharacterized protein GLAREA_08829 [Glarea lozoyensis ATCC 20868]EPE36666.1 hypothetical protein GLAREA_08829 [Glarea lozoyensis ATCC 20868]